MRVFLILVFISCQHWNRGHARQWSKPEISIAAQDFPHFRDSDHTPWSHVSDSNTVKAKDRIEPKVTHGISNLAEKGLPKEPLKQALDDEYDKGVFAPHVRRSPFIATDSETSTSSNETPKKSPVKPLNSESLREVLNNVQLPQRVKDDLFNLLQRHPSVKLDNYNSISKAIEARLEGYKNLGLLSGKSIPPFVLGQMNRLKISIRAEMHKDSSEGSSRSSRSAKQVTRWKEQEAMKVVHERKQTIDFQRERSGNARGVGSRVRRKRLKASFHGGELANGQNVQAQKKQAGRTNYTKTNQRGRSKSERIERNDPAGIAKGGILPPKGGSGRGRRGKQNNEQDQHQGKTDGQHGKQNQNPGMSHFQVNAPLLVQGSMHLDQNTLMEINAPTHIGGRVHIHGPWHRRSLDWKQEISLLAQKKEEIQRSKAS